jgi:hypothetical protein
MLYGKMAQEFENNPTPFYLLNSIPIPKLHRLAKLENYVKQ